MSALTLFCDILRTEMDLDDDQVYIYNQKFTVPKDQRLYIAVGILALKPFGNSSQMEATEEGLNEVLSVNMHATLSVNIMSKSMDALTRKEEVILALISSYAQGLQEANAFKIGTLPSDFTNLSELDGPAIPYRFNISVGIQYMVSKTKSVPYYDNYTDSVITDP